MKKTLKIYSGLFLVIALLLPHGIHAETPLHTVKKTVLKRFVIGAGQRLAINNQYGDVVIKNWRSPNVLVRITLSGQSANLARAKSLLKLIRIATQTDAGAISIKTIIDTLSSRTQPAAYEHCHISYQVFAPPGLRLKVTNNVGDVDAGNFQGDLEIIEKLGDFKAETLNGPVRLDLEQGNIVINRLNNGYITVKGFQTIRIGALAGITNARFASGNHVDLGLSADLQKLTLEADNVNPLNLFSLRTVGAALKVHTLLSKFIYDGVIQFKMAKSTPAKMDSLLARIKERDTSKEARDKILDLKKLKAIPLKKENDYEFKTGNGSTEIKLNVAFCVLNVKD